MQTNLSLSLSIYIYVAYGPPAATPRGSPGASARRKVREMGGAYHYYCDVCLLVCLFRLIISIIVISVVIMVIIISVTITNIISVNTMIIVISIIHK